MSRDSVETPWADYHKVGHARFRSAAFRLFHFTYKCTIPEYYFLTDFEITKIGVSMEGDTYGGDRLMSPKTTDCTPAFMAMTLGSGGYVSIHSLEDVVKIYDDCVEHIGDWYKAVMEEGRVIDVPIEDLYAFEQMVLDYHQDVDKYKREDPSAVERMARFTGRTGSWQREGLTGYRSMPYLPRVPKIENYLIDRSIQSGRLHV